MNVIAKPSRARLPILVEWITQSSCIAKKNALKKHSTNACFSGQFFIGCNPTLLSISTLVLETLAFTPLFLLSDLLRKALRSQALRTTEEPLKNIFCLNNHFTLNIPSKRPVDWHMAARYMKQIKQF